MTTLDPELIENCAHYLEGRFADPRFAAAIRALALPPQPVEVTEEMATAAGEVIEKQVGAFADMSPSFYPWLARQALEAALRPSGDGIRAGRAEVIEECAKVAAANARWTGRGDATAGYAAITTAANIAAAIRALIVPQEAVKE